jgi:hypothetical protein
MAEYFLTAVVRAEQQIDPDASYFAAVQVVVYFGHVVVEVAVAGVACNLALAADCLAVSNLGQHAAAAVAKLAVGQQRFAQLVVFVDS